MQTGSGQSLNERALRHPSKSGAVCFVPHTLAPRPELTTSQGQLRRHGALELRTALVRSAACCRSSGWCRRN
jgi:hypothetical protein